MHKQLAMLAIVMLLNGCAQVKFDSPMDAAQPKTFTYEYSIPGTKLDLWRKGRDFFASTYVDSRTVIKVADEHAGTLTGRGLSIWVLGATTRYPSTCASAYHIRFATANNKARLQFEIINGNPPESRCHGWPLPSADGYLGMRKQFHDLHIALGNALKQENFSTFSAE